MAASMADTAGRELEERALQLEQRAEQRGRKHEAKTAKAANLLGRHIQKIDQLQNTSAILRRAVLRSWVHLCQRILAETVAWAFGKWGGLLHSCRLQEREERAAAKALVKLERWAWPVSPPSHSSTPTQSLVHLNHSTNQISQYSYN